MGSDPAFSLTAALSGFFGLIIISSVHNVYEIMINIYA